MARRKKQTLPEGTIVRIPYGDGKQAYAQVLVSPWIRVFEGPAGAEDDDVGRIVARPERYRLAVSAYTLGDGRWPVVGRVPLRPEDRWIPDRFVQDLARPAILRIVTTTPEGDERERPATVDECQGLEAASAWDLVHVEQRLADEDAGVPNLSLLAQRLVHPGDVFTIMLDRGANAAGHWVVSGKAHVDVHPGQPVLLGSASGPRLNVEAVMTYADDRPQPYIFAGGAGTLHLSGEIPPEARSERVLRRA